MNPNTNQSNIISFINFRQINASSYIPDNVSENILQNMDWHTWIAHWNANPQEKQLKYMKQRALVLDENHSPSALLIENFHLIEKLKIMPSANVHNNADNSIYNNMTALTDLEIRGASGPIDYILSSHLKNISVSGMGTIEDLIEPLIEQNIGIEHLTYINAHIDNASCLELINNKSLRELHLIDVSVTCFWHLNAYVTVSDNLESLAILGNCSMMLQQSFLQNTVPNRSQLKNLELTIDDFQEPNYAHIIRFQELERISFEYSNFRIMRNIFETLKQLPNLKQIRLELVPPIGQPLTEEMIISHTELIMENIPIFERLNVELS